MIGLYYPFIHFRDENWLKFALLHWNQIARIVPDTYRAKDSAGVRLVRDELGAITDVSPMEASPDVVEGFLTVVRRHGNELRKTYDIALADKWKPDPHTVARAPGGADAKFAYIFHEKLGYALSECLCNERLAIRGEGQDGRWLGVHPALAAVYMTALAESIAKRSGYGLLADDLVRHVAVGAPTLERLAEMLLKGRVRATRDGGVPPDALAVFALRTVIPRNLKGIPLSAIVKFRKERAVELTAFQKWMHGLAGDLTKGNIKSRAAMRQHLSVLDRDEIKPRVDDLQRQFRDLGWETAAGAIGVKSPWAISGAALALYLSSPAIAVAGIAFAAAATVGKQRREAKKLVAANPAAYLMFARERLAPQKLVERVTTRIRKTVLDT